MEIIQSLPDIVKREIAFPKLNEVTEEGKQQRRETTFRVIVLLDVNMEGTTLEEMEKDKHLKISNFGTFLRGYHLTGMEVIEAYTMALRKELPIKTVYKSLDVVQCGEILNAYIIYKRNNNARMEALKKLNNLLNPSPKITEKRKEEIDLQFKKVMYEAIRETGFYEYADFYYDEFQISGRFDDWDLNSRKNLYQEVKSDIRKELRGKAPLRNSQKKWKENMGNGNHKNLIKRKCRAMLVSDYLKKYCGSFDEFLKVF